MYYKKLVSPTYFCHRSILRFHLYSATGRYRVSINSEILTLTFKVSTGAVTLATLAVRFTVALTILVQKFTEALTLIDRYVAVLVVTYVLSFFSVACTIIHCYASLFLLSLPRFFYFGSNYSVSC